MKYLLLTTIFSLLLYSPSITAADTAQGHSRYRFARLEATETSWDHTSIIYEIIDAAGHSISLAPSQITYTVRDKSRYAVASGKGVFVNINDTRLQSEEDYSITITASVKKEKISSTIYRKASPKKLILRQQGTATLYQMVRTKYSSPAEYEALHIDASSMSVSVSFANCSDCATFKVADNASHTTLTDANSYKSFESTLKDMTLKGKKVQMVLQPTITVKGSSIRYAESHYEISPDAVREVHVEPATAADKEAGE